ncbi:hypothetical protein FLA_1310 [Filimonas lacunae]|nr:hypothetical protein FLA_1310 [Filimonas lacunae]
MFARGKGWSDKYLFIGSSSRQVAMWYFVEKPVEAADIMFV